jgi:GNAT superfamily N-acetyltransferase
MPQDWTLRRAGAADADTLALIGSATFLETFAGLLQGPDIVAHCAAKHSAAVYAGWAAEDLPMWLGEAREGAAPIGYAVLTRPDLPIADIAERELELKRIYTLSRFHGTGLGSALMAAAIEEARALGAPRLLLGVYAHNLRARAFYARQGFVQVGERHFRVGTMDCEDVILGLPL